MAIALVSQTAQNDASGHDADVLTIPASRGGTFLLLIVWQAAAATSVSYTVTDNKGGSWVYPVSASTVTDGPPPVDNVGGNNSDVSLAYLPNCPAGITQIVVNWRATSKTNAVNLTEWSGVAFVNEIDAQTHGGGGTAGTAQVSPRMRTQFPNDLIVSAVTIPSGTLTLDQANSEPGSGWTELTRGTMGGVTGSAAYQIVSTISGYRIAWTLGTSGVAGMVAIAIRGGNGPTGAFE